MFYFMNRIDWQWRRCKVLTRIFSTWGYDIAWTTFNPSVCRRLEVRYSCLVLTFMLHHLVEYPIRCWLCYIFASFKIPVSIIKRISRLLNKYNQNQQYFVTSFWADKQRAISSVPTPNFDNGFENIFRQQIRKVPQRMKANVAAPILWRQCKFIKIEPNGKALDVYTILNRECKLKSVVI